jgi:hypothetical protein
MVALETLRLSQRGHVLTARLDTPPGDGLSTPLQKDLIDLARAVDADPTVSVVVVATPETGRDVTRDIARLLSTVMSASLPAKLMLGAMRAARAGADARFADRIRVVGAITAGHIRERAARMRGPRAVWFTQTGGSCRMVDLSRPLDGRRPATRPVRLGPSVSDRRGPRARS